MTLIKEIKLAPKLWSIWALIILPIAGYMVSNWDDLNLVVPKSWHPLILAVLSIIGILSRIVVQDTLPTTDEVKS